METLKTYLKALGSENDREHFARSCGTSLGHIRNCLYDEKKRLNFETCALIERATAGVVTCKELRPDIRWRRVKDAAWPHPKGRPLIDVAYAARV